jgi:hypothetical protein
MIEIEELGKHGHIWTSIGTNEPPTDKSVDYRAFRLQITIEGIIEIFAQ